MNTKANHDQLTQIEQRILVELADDLSAEGIPVYTDRGPYGQIGFLACANTKTALEILDDAFNVHHETGLTPREILAQRDELSDLLQREIAVNKCILTLIEQAYDRFTDNDMVPPNHALEKWLAKARVCMTHAGSTESGAAIHPDREA